MKQSLIIRILEKFQAKEEVFLSRKEPNWNFIVTDSKTDPSFKYEMFLSYKKTKKIKSLGHKNSLHSASQFFSKNIKNKSDEYIASRFDFKI